MCRPEMPCTPLPPDATEVMVDGHWRPARNAQAQPIHPTVEGVRNFWRWFEPDLAASTIEITDEMRAAYSGQTNHRLTLVAPGGGSGTLDYSVYRGVPMIQGIDVPPSHRRRGIGRVLVQSLQSLFPDREIDWGMMTPSGAALRQSLPKRTKESEAAEAHRELAVTRDHLETLNQKAHQGTLTEAELAGWNDLHDQCGDLQAQVAGQSALKTLIEIPSDFRVKSRNPLVDALGRPLVLYHGTKSDLTYFDPRRRGYSDPGLFGKALYFTGNPEQAGAFAMSPHYGRGDASHVLPVYVRLGASLQIEEGQLPDGRALSDLHPQGLTQDSAASAQQLLRETGADGAVLMMAGEILQVVALDSRQVKSALGNSGLFDPLSVHLTDSEVLSCASDLSPVSFEKRREIRLDPF